MARSELEVIVKVAAREAVRELKSLEKSVEDTGKQTKSTGLVFTELRSQLDLAVGAARTVGQAFKAAFDLSFEGAQILQTRESFDTLLDSIGAAPDLLDQLQDAADGTIDELTLMSSVATLTAGAGDEVAQAMAEASPRLLEISRAASKLNPRLGDSSKLFEDIGTGIKRASPLILDNLGLTIKLGPAQERFAESLGKTVDELTEEEKQLAILNDTLRAGDVLIEQVGGSVESLTDDFNRFKTSTTQLSDELKVLFGPALGSVFSGLSEQEDALTKIIRAYNEGKISAFQLAAGWNALTRRAFDVTEAVDEANESYERNRKLTEELIPETESFDRQVRLASETMQTANAAIDGWNQGVSSVSAATFDAERATDAYSDRMQGLATHIIESEQAQGAFNQRLDRLNSESAQAIENLRNIQSPLESFLDTVDTSLDSPIKAFIEDLQFLAVGGAKITEEIPRLLDEIADKVTKGLLTPEQAEELSGGLLAGFLQAKEEAGQIDFTEASRNLSDALQIPIVESRALLEEQDPIGEVQRQLDAIDASLVKQQTLEFTEGLEGVGTASEVMTDGVTGNLNTIESEWKGPITAAQKYLSIIESIPTEVTTNVNLRGADARAGAGGQHGLDFTVPPGFPRDSYPIYASSGERVIVQTRAQQGQGGGTMSLNIQSLNINTPSTDASGIAADIVAALGEQARLAGMSGTFAQGT